MVHNANDFILSMVYNVLLSERPGFDSPLVCRKHEFKIVTVSLQGNSDHALYQSGGLVYWDFHPQAPKRSWRRGGKHSDRPDPDLCGHTYNRGQLAGKRS